MSKGKKIICAFLVLVGLLLPVVSGGEKVSAWIGTGSGGGGSYSGGGGWLNCDTWEMWRYAVDCAGLSWAYYTADYETSSSVGFPYLDKWPENELNVSGASIPAECSKGSGTRGFWHFGANGFGIRLSGTTIHTDGSTWYGHWFTMNPGHYTASWAPYKTTSLSGVTKQSVGAYTLNKYGSASEATRDYQKAWVYEQRKAGRNVTLDDAPDSIPGDVWGFCYGDYMENVTLTVRAIDTAGHSLASLMADKSVEVGIGESASVTVDNIAGYTKEYWGTGTSSSTWRSDTGLTYTENIDEDKVIYAVYQRNEFAGRARAFAGDSNSGTAVADTGYQEGDTARDALIDCENAGCKATFDLYLKTVKGSGKTTFTGGWWSTASNKWNGMNSFNYASPYAPSTSGTEMKKYTTTLMPGNKYCMRITFNPLGSKGNDDTATEGTCAEAKVTYFKGKTTVSGATSGTTDWQNSNTSKTFYVNNCSPTSGCKVSFAHALSRSNSIGSTDWTVSRGSNLTSGTRKIEGNSNLASGTFAESSAKTVKSDTNLVLYPGMVVCEKITFKPNNKEGTGNVYTRVCVSALGNAQPDSPDSNGDNTLLKIKVKNNSVNSYKNFQDEVYAKPGDQLVYRTTYNPVLQYTYYLKPQKMRINNGTVYPSDSTNSSDTLGAMYNSKRTGGLKDWNNGFTAYTSNNFYGGSYERTYGAVSSITGSLKTKVGDMSEKTNDHTYTVDARDVGKSLVENARTNHNNNAKTTPSQVNFSRDGSGYNLGKVITTQITDAVSAKIPYNFINSTYVETNDTDSNYTDPTFYAGESAAVKMNIAVSPKQNNTTNGKYATIVRNAKWKLIFCVGDAKCNANNYEYETDPSSGLQSQATIGNLNTGYNTNGDSSIKKSITINVPDVAAGTKLCVKSAVYPANSGNDKNWDDSEGSHTWAISAPVCYNVAKKPNMEVWGGNIYSRGKINASLSNKGALAGYQNYKIEGPYSSRYVFGSWGELGLIANGVVTNFSSGASLGFAANDDGVLTPKPILSDDESNNSPKASSPGGSNKTSLCDRSPLTFANGSCSPTTAGVLGGSATMNSVAEDKSAIIARYIYRGEGNIAGEVTLNDEEKLKNNNVYYYYYNDNNGDGPSLPAGVVNKNTTQVVHSTRNITINGDLTYEGGYTNYEEMPKLIIYAEGDIKINCGVKRIDAVLIAEDNVTTCSGSDDIDAQINSNQLIINGAIIANSLTPNRTYGAATGANSIVPAEIINFDPTLYMWGGHRSETAGSPDASADLDVVYNKELAPRE